MKNTHFSSYAKVAIVGCRHWQTKMHRLYVRLQKWFNKTFKNGILSLVEVLENNPNKTSAMNHPRCLVLVSGVNNRQAIDEWKKLLIRN